jgi:ribonuclease HI
VGDIPAEEDEASGREGQPLPKVALYARGCVLGTPGPGGYGVVLVFSSGRTRELSGGLENTTNNVVELRAVIAGLAAIPQPFQVTLYTTSKYVSEGAERWLALWERSSWRTRGGQPVKNQEIWLELSRALGDHDVSWVHLADRTDPHGRQAAALARAAAEAVRHG